MTDWCCPHIYLEIKSPLPTASIGMCCMADKESLKGGKGFKPRGPWSFTDMVFAEDHPHYFHLRFECYGTRLHAPWPAFLAQRQSACLHVVFPKGMTGYIDTTQNSLKILGRPEKWLARAAEWCTHLPSSLFSQDSDKNSTRDSSVA